MSMDRERETRICVLYKNAANCQGYIVSVVDEINMNIGPERMMLTGKPKFTE